MYKAVSGRSSRPINRPGKANKCEVERPSIDDDDEDDDDRRHQILIL